MPKLDDYKRILTAIVEESQSVTELKQMFKVTVKGKLKAKLQQEALRYREIESDHKTRAAELESLVTSVDTDLV